MVPESLTRSHWHTLRCNGHGPVNSERRARRRALFFSEWYHNVRFIMADFHDSDRGSLSEAGRSLPQAKVGDSGLSGGPGPGAAAGHGMPGNLKAAARIPSHSSNLRMAVTRTRLPDPASLRLAIRAGPNGPPAAPGRQSRVTLALRLAPVHLTRTPGPAAREQQFKNVN
jgi:hypothetical protein